MADAKTLQNMQILENFAHVESELEFVAKEIQYHNSCRNTFRNQARSKTMRIEEEQKSERAKKIAIGEQAFFASTSYIQDVVLERAEILKAREVAGLYRMLLAGFGLDQNDIYKDRDYLFLAKLTEHFEGKILIMKHPTKGVGKTVFSSQIDPSKAFALVYSENMGMAFRVKL